jgi:rhodanese-related sulfurtransferase
MATYRDLLSAAKAQINEVDTAGAAERIAAGALALDVREPEEFDQGALPGALHIPRGNLESNIESRVIDKSARVVV